MIPPSRMTRLPCRTLALSVIVIAVLCGIYGLWSPGNKVTDGRHDLGSN